MTDGSSKDNLLLKTVPGILSGMVLLVFGGFVGYWINSYLSRDNLSIEFVRFVPTTQAQVPLTEINRKLHQLGSYPVYQPNSMSTTNRPPCNLGGSYPGAYSNSPITAAVVRSFQRCLESYADENNLMSESLHKLLSDLDKNPPPATLDTIILSWSGFFDCSRILSPEQKVQNAKRGVKAAISNSAEIARADDELLELVKQIKIIRTGNLTVLATIRNTGDTDGLVMAEDFLILNKNSARLPIQLLGTGAIVSVPKRSAVSITFLLDPSVLPEPPRVAVTELLKQAQYIDLKGKVILKDTRNRDFESKEFDFPAGPDE